MAERLPYVSIIIPARNEQTQVARCLDALVAQDYPLDRIEILFVDGCSADGTREIVANYGRRCPQIRLLDNPRRIVPAALNIGLRQAKGAVIIRVDGHCVVARDYVTQCVKRLLETGADNVGGPMRAIGQGYVAVAIALATSSPFGVGNARFHYSRCEEYVDTVYLGAYRREVFDRIGLFDEELVRNQDDELNYRLRAAGGKILLSPTIRSYYFGRTRLRDLFHQYFQYGYWKIRVAQKHPRALRPRHLAPAAFVLLIAGLGLAGIASRRARIAGVAVGAAYAMAAVGFAARATSDHRRRHLPAVVAAFACLHLGYGAGFLAGLVNLLHRGRRRRIDGR